MAYALKAEGFHPSEVREAGTWFDVPTEAEAAYDAPYPSRIYMAGVRVFPSLINELAGVNAEARAGLDAFERPFLTIWAANDAGGLGSCEVQDDFICNVHCKGNVVKCCDHYITLQSTSFKQVPH